MSRAISFPTLSASLLTMTLAMGCSDSSDSTPSTPAELDLTSLDNQRHLMVNQSNTIEGVYLFNLYSNSEMKAGYVQPTDGEVIEFAWRGLIQIIVDEDNGDIHVAQCPTEADALEGQYTPTGNGGILLPRFGDAELQIKENKKFSVEGFDAFNIGDEIPFHFEGFKIAESPELSEERHRHLINHHKIIGFKFKNSSLRLDTLVDQDSSLEQPYNGKITCVDYIKQTLSNYDEGLLEEINNVLLFAAVSEDMNEEEAGVYVYQEHILDEWDEEQSTFTRERTLDSVSAWYKNYSPYIYSNEDNPEPLDGLAIDLSSSSWLLMVDAQQTNNEKTQSISAEVNLLWQ
ncbi:Uncharacterised protein [BD1-7 clade bacterium]|uniref:Phytase-like domain-containing protein n=1 Tax=BD1-7 clade bacterium TaxID=2029982 RepID=A0A5S9Q6K5_9GAMM|nr:Uncharacterised protein [BD1-7 clade bacterium]CAA0113328.1 Uncharacterised protein [BD1-7 clade bacterium]